MNINGLTDEQVIENRKKYGRNSFTKKKKDSFWKLLLETFSDPIIKILLIALGIKIIFLIKDFDWYETIGIAISILFASLISSISEYGATNAFEKLTEEAQKINVRVKRNGNIITISIDEIVVNDIVVVFMFFSLIYCSSISLTFSSKLFNSNGFELLIFDLIFVRAV